jgi:penicillin-binding protein 1B
MAKRKKIWRSARAAALALLLLAAGVTLYLDIRVRSEFEGRRFALPARIYARPLELHAGLRITQAEVVDELRQIGYREAPPEGESGWFVKRGNELEVALRPFVFWDGRQPAKRISVIFDGGNVAALRDAGGAELPLARLEPLAIGGIYPSGNEDRVLVRLEDVPKHRADPGRGGDGASARARFDVRGLARAPQLFTDRVRGGAPSRSSS